MPVGDGHLAREDVGEVVPPLRRAEELPEQPKRVRVLRIDREDLLVGGDRAIPVRELFGHDLRHLEQEFLARRRRWRDVREPFQRPRELARRPHLAVDAGERPERLRGGRLRGDLLEPAHREVEPAEPLGRDHREPPPHVERRRAGELRTERLLEGAGELRPGARRGSEPLEIRAHGGRVLAAPDRVVELPELRAEGLRAIPEPLVQRGELREEPRTLRVVGRREPDLEQPRELAGVAARAVHVLEHARGVGRRLRAREEPLEAGDRAGVARALGEHVGVRLDGGPRIGAGLEEGGAPQVQLDPPHGVVAGRQREGAEHLDELRAGLCAGEEPLELEQRLERLRVGLARGAERLERGGGIAHLLDDLRGVEQEREPLGAGRERGAAPRDAQDLRRRPRCLVEPLELLERLRVVGRGREHPLPGLDRVGPAAGRPRAGGPPQERDRLVRKGRGGGLIEHRRELVVAAGRAREALEVDLHAFARRAALRERPAGGHERQVGRPEVSLEQRPDLREQPRPLARILDRCEARLARGDAARVLAGRPQRGVRCLERLAPDRAGDGGEGDDGVARGLAARIAPEQLGVERERARRVGEPLAAELGEPRDEVGVEAAREPGLERSRELGGPIEPLEEPLERRAGVGVVGGEPSHLAPRCGRPGAVSEARLRDGRLLAQRVLALRGVRGAARELGAKIRELAPALASPVEPPQRRERLAVARRGHEHARPGVGGALGVEPPVGEVGLLAQEGGAELRRSLLAQGGVQLRAGLELLALGREPAQVATRVRVRRVRPHRRRDRGEGERHLVQLLLRHARRAPERGRLGDRLRPDARLRLERPHAAARVGVGGEPGGRDEDRPRVLPVELRLQRGQRGGVLRVRGEGGGEPRCGGGEIADPLRDLGGLERRA